VEFLIAAVALLVLRSRAASEVAPDDKKPTPAPPPKAGDSGQVDVAGLVGSGLGAAGAIVGALGGTGGITALFGGGSAAAVSGAAGGATAGAAGGATAGGSAVVAGGGTASGAGGAGGAVAGTAGSTAGATSATLATVLGNVAPPLIAAALIIIIITVVGPNMAKLVEGQQEWARRRKYGKAGVLANLTERAFTLEQEMCEAVFTALGATFGRTYRTDAAASYGGGAQTQMWQISNVNGLGRAASIPEVQAAVLECSRVIAIEQLRARNAAILSFFKIGRLFTEADCAAQGVAVSSADFDGWVRDYCLAHDTTTWGVSLTTPWGQDAEDPYARSAFGVVSRVGTLESARPPRPLEPAGRDRTYAHAGLVLGSIGESVVARARFNGVASAVTMVAVEGFGFSVSYPGDKTFSTLVASYCGLFWTQRGAWIIDRVSGMAIDPSRCRLFQAPVVANERLINAAGVDVSGGDAHVAKLALAVAGWHA
jgi:hypothetical protein